MPTSARALCELIRQQARRKLRAERQRVLQGRELAREAARKQAALGGSTIPSTEMEAEWGRRMALAERAEGFRRQQRLQAAVDAWQLQQKALGETEAAAVDADQEQEDELQQRRRLLEAAAALLERARLRSALRAWQAAAADATAAAMRQQAIEQGRERLTMCMQRRALGAWQRAAVQGKRLPTTSSATGAGELQQAAAASGGGGMVWLAWLKKEVARVVAPPRATADADEYLEEL